jgi:uncharacterized membrane protein YtjA (UPF0391 family)
MGPPIALFIRDLEKTPHGGVGCRPRFGTGIPMQRYSVEARRSWEMLYWALMFLVIALVAAVFGFGGIASTATGMAQILFVIALVLFIVSLFAGFLRRNL